MDDATAPNAPTAADLDPATADPRELMRALLPPARSKYLKAWELLADTNTPLERRRLAREHAKAIAADHAVVADFLRTREQTLKGDDLHNVRHLVAELERHAAALERIATVALVNLVEAKDLRPEALGCGKRYRDPATASASAAPSSRGSRDGAPAARDSKDRDRGRGSDPLKDRGPKVDRSALGTSKHDSSVGGDLDEATRLKLEAMRAALEGDA
ncbi:MAG: hypothetical protein JWO69_1326 [Thermoleophilia bacterium]|nr:hypothetical protein [Thermoleophilia bacterium]